MLNNNIDNEDSSSTSVHQPGSTCFRIFYPLYMVFIKYPSHIMRVIFQFGEIYFFLGMVSFTIQYFLILMTSAARIPKNAEIVYIFILLFLFSFLFGNVLTIPLWEFIQFRWLSNVNPFQTILNILQLNTQRKTSKTLGVVLGFILGLYFWSYLALGFLGYQSFDIENYIVLFFIPMLKFISIYLCYGYRAIESFLHIGIFRNEDNITNDRCLDPFIITMKEKKFKSLTQMICAIIHHFVDWGSYTNEWVLKIKSFLEYYGQNLDNVTWERYLCVIVKEIVIFAVLNYIVEIRKKSDFLWYEIAIPIIVWLYNSILAFAINMPIWILDIFHRWDKWNQIKAIEGIDKQIRNGKQFNGFKYINSGCKTIIPLLIIAFYVFRVTKDSSTFEPINEQTFWNGTLSHNYDNIQYSKKQVRSPMCGLGIYHLNLLQIGSIASAAYNNNDNLTQYYLKNSFFRDENIELSYLKHVLDKDNHAVLLRADINIKESSRNLTIFAVRGSTTGIDWWLNFEIFISSALISVARWFPVLQSYESFAAKIIGRFMNSPMTFMYKATLTYDYTEPMFKEVQDFLNKPENQMRTVLFTGHSLGGGLSKILANKFGMQSVAFSGPGISPIEDKFKKDDYDIYFKTKFIDVVPDNDFVPRFEVSGGTRYRVLCEQNGGECHSILRTICQLGVSCDLEYYSGDFCRGRYSMDEYNDMISLAHGHRKYSSDDI